MSEHVADPPTDAVTVGHITVTAKGDRLDASCGFCHTGMEVGASFGPIPGETLILEFAKQHTHTPKTKKGGARRG